MKRIIIIIISTIVAFTTFAQTDSVDKIDNGHLTLTTMAGFGKNYNDKNVFVNTFGMDYSKQISNKLNLRVGANITNVEGDVFCEDKAPRRRKDAGMYVGMDYKVNDNLLLSGTIFYNTFSSTLGANVNMEYKFNENTTLDFSMTFVERLNSPCYHQTISNR